jgi:hypothetical protein
MLWIISGILFIICFFGWLSSYTSGGAMDVLLFISFIVSVVLLVQGRKSF